MLQRCFEYQCGSDLECTENTCFLSYPNSPHKRLRRRNACPAWVRHPSVPALSTYAYQTDVSLVPAKQVLQPWPLLAYAVEDELRARAVRHVGWGEVQHQQASIRVDDNVPLTADRLLGSLGISGSIRTHSSSVRSVGYRLVLRAMSAIRPRLSRVHILNFNHNRRCRHNHSQTGSNGPGAYRNGWKVAGGQSLDGFSASRF